MWLEKYGQGILTRFFSFGLFSLNYIYFNDSSPEVSCRSTVRPEHTEEVACANICLTQNTNIRTYWGYSFSTQTKKEGIQGLLDLCFVFCATKLTLLYCRYGASFFRTETKAFIHSRYILPPRFEPNTISNCTCPHGIFTTRLIGVSINFIDINFFILWWVEWGGSIE